MRQNKTKQMLSYWLELFHAAQEKSSDTETIAWPDRSDVHPTRCRDLLGDMFILENKRDQLVYRLAGTKLCSMFGEEQKQKPFSAPFSGADRRSAEDWVKRLNEENYLVVISSFGLTDKGERINLETLLMPLSHNGIRGSRILGITSAGDTPYWLGTEPVTEQVIRSVRVLRPWEGDTYMSNWPFKKPDQSNIEERRVNLEAPALYAETNKELDDQPNSRRVAHLTVLQGGRKN
jgi:hypothetical protein